MKKVICFLLAALLLVALLAALCACVEQGENSQTTTAGSENSSKIASDSESSVSTEPSEMTSEPDEGSPDAASGVSFAESGETDKSEEGVLYDEAGNAIQNVVFSDPPTYEEVLALYRQDPETYRDPGDLQPECQEMVKLEDGQWYQSFVASSYNCRFILWNAEETEATGWWSAAIGSEKNYFLFNVGVLYDDPGGQMQYEERPIAVRGTLAEGRDGYAYELRLPDELIVCVEQPANPWGGTCYIEGTETLAIPEEEAALLEGKTGEVTVTGVVMWMEKDGVFYLKDVKLYP